MSASYVWFSTIDSEHTMRVLMPPVMSALAVALFLLLIFTMCFDRPKQRKRRHQHSKRQ